jgi:hypothetical protein
VILGQNGVRGKMRAANEQSQVQASQAGKGGSLPFRLFEHAQRAPRAVQDRVSARVS